ncbi:MAG: SDR family oxidoreductase [Nanoarchaeota archaeon]|nr:SDR family oxidoreductase [Nanoarchaeota archaeon]
MAKTIIITGASSGIGKATAELLSEQGYKLILLARKKEILDEIAKKNKNCLVYPCDLMNAEEAEKISKKITEDFPIIDVLVNNAGVGFPTKLDEISIEDYDKIMDTNIKGLVLFTKNILKQMEKNNSGHIINVSSPAGIQSNPVAPIYCTSKFALEGYTQGLRMHIKETKKNIRVTCVRPGGVDTNYWGKRDVDRTKFMTSEEMALVLKFVIDFPKDSNVQDITMESVRY